MNRVYPFLLTVAVLLAACENESGFTGLANQPPVGGSGPGGIDATNAKQAARVAYAATVQSMGTGQRVGNSGIASSPANGFQKPAVQRSASGLLTRFIQKVPLGPDTYDCGVAGTTTISGDLADLFTLTAGDTINMDAVDCDDGLGEVINGRMELTVVSFTGDLLLGGPYTLSMGVVLIDFEVATALDTVVSNGDSTVTIDTTGDPLIVMSISGTSLTNQSLTSTETLSGFATTQTVDLSVAPEPYTLTAMGSIATTQLTLSIDYTTPVTFQGAGEGYPFAGEMLITSADGGAVRLIALDENTVRIMTDADGDSTFESSEDTTWDDIAI